MRGEKAKSCEFPKVRFMESPDLRISDAHWDLEPIVPKTAPKSRTKDEHEDEACPAVARR